MKEKERRMQACRGKKTMMHEGRNGGGTEGKRTRMEKDFKIVLALHVCNVLKRFQMRIVCHFGI